MSLRCRGRENRECGGPLGKKLCLTSKDRPANWNGHTFSGYALDQDFLPFSRPTSPETPGTWATVGHLL